MADPAVIEISSSPAANQSKAAHSSHRLPTVSASQALQDLQTNDTGSVSLGLPALDTRLSDVNGGGNVGIECGKVTELWGPSGAGKTALALQAASNTLAKGNAVIWIDAAATLSSGRLKSITSASSESPSKPPLQHSTQAFNQLRAPTLSHLMAILMHPPEHAVPDNTGLLVVDDINMLVDLDYPRQLFASSAKTEQQKWQSSRRYGILGSLVSALNRLAVLKSLAVIITTGSSTRMRPDSGLSAALAPGIGGAEWEAGVWNRMVVFRDFSGRLVGLQKCQGKSLISREEIGETGPIYAFDMTIYGSIEVRSNAQAADGASIALAKARISPVKPRKRTFDEVADSESEEVDEYGWADADDDVLAAEGIGEENASVGQTIIGNG